MGVFEDPALRGGHAGRRARAWPTSRHDDRRRRRVGPGRRAGGAGRQAEPRVHGWRRVAGVHRRQGPARAWLRCGATADEHRDSRSSPGNWKMNTTIAEGLALVDAMLPRLQAYRLGRARRVPAVRVAGGGRGATARNRHRCRRAEPAPGTQGRVHGRDRAGDARRAWRRTSFSGTPSVGSTLARTTRSSIARSRPRSPAGWCRSCASARRLEQNERGETEAFVAGQVRGGARRRGAPVGGGGRLRADLGDRHGSGGHAGGRQRDDRVIRRTVASSAAKPSPTGLQRAVWRQRHRRTTSRRSSPSQTSTARWSAARACGLTSSSRSCASPRRGR